MFKIPKPVVPSTEEMQCIAVEWWRKHEHINMLEWNDVLVANTFPFECVKVPKELTEQTIGMTKRIDINYLVNGYEPLLIPALEKLGCSKNFFIKTVSRSPKDFLYKDDTSKPNSLSSVEDAVMAISGSLRCFEDICMLYYIDKYYLIVRPYIDFSPRDEWRVFVKDGEVIGITQYYYAANFEYTSLELSMIESNIKSFMHKIVIPNVGTDTYVADIVLHETPTLLELNPYGLSDPCLYVDYKSFDGKIKANIN